MFDNNFAPQEGGGLLGLNLGQRMQQQMTNPLFAAGLQMMANNGQRGTSAMAGVPQAMMGAQDAAKKQQDEQKELKRREKIGQFLSLKYPEFAPIAMEDPEMALKLATMKGAGKNFDFKTLPDGTYGTFDPDTGQFSPLGQSAKAAEPTTNMRELEAAGLKPGTPEYQEALLGLKKPKGMIIESDGQGGFRMAQGTDLGTSLNVEQGKNTGFLLRAQDANEAITKLEKEGTSAWNKLAGGVPVVGNYLVGEDSQKLTQAKRDFINAVLRQESGAVISPEEFANAEQQYFPQPGDGDDVIAQKRKNRENAIAGFRIRSGPGASVVDQMQPQQGQTGVVDYREFFGGE